MEPTAKIFLNDERGLLSSYQAKSLCTFNFQSFQHPFKTPFEALFFFNDEYLEAQQKIENKIKTQSVLMILPITGELIVEIRNKHISVEVGQVLVFNHNDVYSILNPNQERINFLHFAIEIETFRETFINLCNFDLVKDSNILIDIFDQNNIQNISSKLKIGQFNGREEAVFRSGYSNVFTFVIAGAFEFQERLLQRGDALALSRHKTIELEALSNYATVLIIEF